jgi:carbamoyl-phosphate synthase large subunit
MGRINKLIDWVTLISRQSLRSTRPTQIIRGSHLSIEPSQRELNVLVFPGGTEVGLEIHSALRSLRGIQLFSVGSDTSNHAPFVFSRHDTVPLISDQSWLDALSEVVDRRKIDFIYPAHDDVLLALAENVDRVAARVLVPPLETCRVTRSKLLTYRLLSDVLPVPKVYLGPDDVEAYPVFLKPERGQGAQRTLTVYCRKELELELERHPDLIICERLPGDEFTVDCFSDRDRGLLYCEGRVRIRTRSGIAMSSRHVSDPAFRDYAEAISLRLPMCGAWFFQVKRDAEGVLRLLEVAPRVAGTMSLHRVMGVNFPLLTILEAMRSPIAVRPNSIDIIVDRALTNRYDHSIRYSTVYVDFDDTLIVRGHVNTLLVRLLYQCVNRGVKLVLVTRHASDLAASLKKHKLTALFDRIVHLVAGEPKSASVTDPDGIFIDDSFRERMEVMSTRGMLTFDASMIEMLIDDRS